MILGSTRLWLSIKSAALITLCTDAREMAREAIAPVLVVLVGSEPGVCVPRAAYDALMHLKVGQCLES